jgi:hypothetical protein
VTEIHRNVQRVIDAGKALGLSVEQRNFRAGAKAATDPAEELGHLSPLRVFIDPDLLQFDEVWAAAGTWHDVFPLSPSDLGRVSGGLVIDIKRDIKRDITAS